MSKLLIPLLAALALPSAVEANWFGKYGSYREAKEACNAWKISGGLASVGPIRDGDGMHDHSVYIRKCEKEEETNQLLGLQRINIKSIIYTWREWDEIENKYYGKVRKRFKY